MKTIQAKENYIDSHADVKDFGDSMINPQILEKIYDTLKSQKTGKLFFGRDRNDVKALEMEIENYPEKKVLQQILMKFFEYSSDWLKNDTHFDNLTFLINT